MESPVKVCHKTNYKEGEMWKKTIILFLILLLVGCATEQPTEKETVPEPIIEKEETITKEAKKTETEPVIETKEAEEIKEPEQRNYLEEFLEEPHISYTYSRFDPFEKRYDDMATDNIILTVCGNTRYDLFSGFFWSTDSDEVVYPYDDMYPNKLLQALESPDHDPELRQGESQMAFVKTKFVKKQYPKSPIDWMEKYKTKKPVSINTNPEIIKIGETLIETRQETFFTKKANMEFNLALDFKNDDGTITTLKFARTIKYPMIIETRNNGVITEKIIYSLDVRDETEENCELLRLLDELLVVTFDDIQKYEEFEIFHGVSPFTEEQAPYVTELHINETKARIDNELKAFFYG